MFLESLMKRCECLGAIACLRLCETCEVHKKESCPIVDHEVAGALCQLRICRLGVLSLLWESVAGISLARGYLWPGIHLRNIRSHPRLDAPFVSSSRRGRNAWSAGGGGQVVGTPCRKGDRRLRKSMRDQECRRAKDVARRWAQ